jgi:integrase/recombinase XerD
MKRWRHAVEDYLVTRRALGFQLKRAGRLLLGFAHFLKHERAATLTVARALQWAQQDSSVQLATQAQRLSIVRGFAQYYRAIDPRTEVPPTSLLPFRPKRARPYLYTETEVRRLLTAALDLSPEDALRRWVYHTLIGLLAVSGLRIEEALDLRLADVDLDAGVLTIRRAKFGQSRLVPLHRSSQKQLITYRERRQRHLAGREVTDFFLVNRRGERMDSSTVRYTFYVLSRRTGLRRIGHNRGPRLHDFRHRFAASTLIRWYRNGADIEQRLPILSTFLGHIHVADTYWYLTACPELMGLAVKRLERRWHDAA